MTVIIKIMTIIAIITINYFVRHVERLFSYKRGTHS